MHRKMEGILKSLAHFNEKRYSQEPCKDSSVP